MWKFSVKKPLTVFVAVIAVLVLGVVAYLNMTPDLFPNMDFPYVMIMTTYPGASPEKVEQEITKPLEQSMATLEHIKEVSSSSAENYSMVMLEFEDSVDLDVIGVDIQQNISALQGNWDDMVGAPYVLKINPSLLPVMVAAVSREDMDTVGLTQFLDEELMSKLEGISGVARVSTSGGVTQQMHVVLDQALLDAANEKMAKAINDKMDAALLQMESAQAEISRAERELDAGQQQLETGKDTLTQQTAQAEAELTYQQTQLINTRSDLKDQLAQLQAAKTQLESMLTLLTSLKTGIETLTSEADAIYQDVETMLALQETAAALQALQEVFDAQIQDIREDITMTQEEKEAAIQAILESQAYQDLVARWEQLEAQLQEKGLDLESLEARLQQSRAAYEDLLQRIQGLKDVLKDNEIDPESLDATISEMQTNLQAINEGIAALEEGISQIDSGMLQIKDAQTLLSQQKSDGLLQIAQATAELSMGKAAMEQAKQQLEEGRQTLEETRKTALEKADLTKLVTMEMVSNILIAQNFSMPAGTLEEAGVSYMVSVGELITQEDQIGDLLLFDPGMEGVDPIYLKDVAAVMLTDNRDETYAKLDGLDSVMLTFEKQSTYATAETTENILARFEKLETEYDGLKFVPLMNQGDYIFLIVESIFSSLLLGAALAVLILLLFLKDLRPTFITLCSIPISVIFAVVLMYFSGVTINMISLSGLAVSVGMLVDNSVVVIENIYRLRSKGATAVQAAVSGAKQVAGAVTASTLTTVCVFAPIVFVEGITRQLFTDLALTMTYSLLASLIVSLTLVPAMASGMLRKELKPEGKLMGKFQLGYEKAAAWSLKHKAIVLVSAGVLLVATAVGSLSKGFIFMPQMDMPNVTVTVSMPEEATMEEAVSMADTVLERIDTLDGIESAGAMMSGGGMSLLGGGGGSLNVTVYITLSDESASGAAVGKEIEALCQDLPCTVEATSVMLDMSMLSGSGIGLQIYADDMQVLQTGAKQAAQVLETVEGVASVDDGLADAAPALLVKVDRNKAMAKGITVAQIYMELATALQNETTVTTLELAGTDTQVLVEKPEGSALTMEQLENYSFSVTDMLTQEEKTFPLSEVATVEQTTSLNSISRMAQRRYLTVTAELDENANVTLVTAQAQQAMKQAQLAQGVSYQFDGENEAIMEAIQQLAIMLLLGVLLVYLVMVAQFQSMKSPFIVMFTIPLAFTGGFAALLICGMEVSVISLIGFIMLTGIIVNNGIVLVDYINQLRLEGTERTAAILEAGKTRMRPILMTTLTTVLGLVDMAVRQNVGTALMQPVAVVCIGGLLYATVMTLFVVPCIYDMINKKPLRQVREEELKELDL